MYRPSSNTFFAREDGKTIPVGERAIRTRFGSAFLASVKANPRLWITYEDDSRAEVQPVATTPVQPVNPLAAVGAGRVAAVDAVIAVL
jgi:hypothetical protein